MLSERRLMKNDQRRSVLSVSSAVRFLILSAVCPQPQCPSTPTFGPYKVPLTIYKSMAWCLAQGLPLFLTLPPQRRPKRYDAHRLRNQSEPDPEKPSSCVVHLDAQHWLDRPALSRARGSLCHALRWLLAYLALSVESIERKHHFAYEQ